MLQKSGDGAKMLVIYAVSSFVRFKGERNMFNKNIELIDKKRPLY